MLFIISLLQTCLITPTDHTFLDLSAQQLKTESARECCRFFIPFKTVIIYSRTFLSISFRAGSPTRHASNRRSQVHGVGAWKPLSTGDALPDSLVQAKCWAPLRVAPPPAAAHVLAFVI